MQQYAQDAVGFNKISFMQSQYLETMKKLTSSQGNLKWVEGMRKWIDEEFKIAEAKFNKILEEDRIKKEKEATQGLPGIIPGAVRRLQEQEKERRKIRKVREDINQMGGDNDKPV